MSPIRIGTRKSKLALWQAEHVADLLSAQGIGSELVLMDTKGDKILDVSISKIGSKGVFTEEIEAALAEGRIDIAVHSAKDMPSTLPDGFDLVAFTDREYPGDVLVSRKETATLSDPEAPLVVGTSSVRRVAFLRHFHPHVKIVDMRGNLQTRIRKMEDGDCDALLLAHAGVHRMGYDDLVKERLPIDSFVPPVGQGCIAIEAHANLDRSILEAVRNAVNHPATEALLLAERAYLKRLDGGCSIPAFALATPVGEDRLRLSAGIVSVDGSTMVKREVDVSCEKGAAAGDRLAREVLDAGGADILAAIRAAD